jgi:cytochrome P450
MPIDSVAGVTAVAAAAGAFMTMKWLKGVVPGTERPPPRSASGLLPFLLQYGYEVSYGQIYDIDSTFVQQSDRAICYRVLHFPVVGIYHKDDIEHVLVSNAGNYIKGFGYDAAKKLLGDGLITMPSGDKHSRDRRIVSPAFSPTALKKITQNALVGHATELLHTLRREVREGSASISRGIFLQEAVSRAALNIVADAAFHMERKDLVQTEATVLKMREGGMQFLEFFPLFSMLPTAGMRSAQEFHRHVTNCVLKAISRVRELSASNPEEHSGRAIIDFLVQSKELTTKELCDHSVTLMFAGFDTSSNTVMWALAHLAQHQDVQQKLFEEMAAVMGPGIYPDVDVVRRCGYLTNVIKETMRVTPVVNDLPRSAVADDVLPYSKVVIPAGTEVDVSIIGAHRNPRVFGPDANDFRPERWEDPSLEQRIGSCGFIPFSAGPRNCIGKDFAWNEMYVLLSLLVRNFSFKFGEGQTFPKQQFTVVVYPEAYRLQIRERVE